MAPAGPEPYYAVYDMWAPVWRQLTPEASLKVRKGNYERIFDAARRRVRLGKGEREMTHGEELKRRHVNGDASTMKRGCCWGPLRLPRNRTCRSRASISARPQDANPAHNQDHEPRGLRLRDARHRAQLRPASIRTGSTRCASPSCRRSRRSSARTAARSPASGRPASASGRRRPPTSAT